MCCLSSAWNINTWESETGRSLQVQSQHALYSEVYASQGYIVRQSLKAKQKSIFEANCNSWNRSTKVCSRILECLGWQTLVINY